MPPATIDKADRARLYNERWPNRPNLNYSGGMLTGYWMIDNNYKNPNPLHGAYPPTYLERVHAMFPDARRVLHVFSGGLTQAAAIDAAGWERNRIELIGVDDADCYQVYSDGKAMELVDLHGPEQGRHPTWQGDVLDMPEEWAGRFDLILADPPHTAKDAAIHKTPMPNRKAFMHALHRVAQPGATLVWLDIVRPMHRKDEWRTWGAIGLARPTNHRVRTAFFFEALGAE